MLRPVVLSIGILTSALMAAAQLTPEVPLSAPEFGTPAGDQMEPVVATNGSEFLVAWQDYRGNPGAIYATRLSRNGRRLDGTGIRLDFDVRWNGHLLGAFYIDGAYTLLYSYQAVFQPAVSRVAAARISDGGQVLEPLHDIYEGESIQAAATNGSTIVLMSGKSFVALNDRNESVATYPMPAGPAYGGAIGSNGTTFLAMTFAYNGTNSVNFIALDGSGSPTVTKSVQTSATGTHAVVASDGQDYLVLYYDVVGGSFVTRHVDSTGTTLAAAKSPGYTAFMWTGESYLATALTGDLSKPQLMAVNLDRDGKPIGESRVLGEGAVAIPTSTTAAWNGAAVLLTWTSGRQDSPYGFDVFGALVSADGTLVSSLNSIASSANAQLGDAVATSGSQDLVVWTEPGGVYATRVDARGTPLDGRGLAVTTDGKPWEIDATWDGTAYIVGWTGANGLKVQRIDRSGALVGPAVEVAHCSASFDLAADDESAAVFYRACTDFPIVAQRLASSGLAGSPVVVTSSGDNPRASWNGSEWLLAWNEFIPIPGLLVSPPPVRGEVFAERLTPAMTVNGPEIPIAVSDNDSDGAPLVATDGRDFLITWAHSSYRDTNGVQIRKVHAGGGRIDDATLLVSGPVAPWSVAWTGRGYTIAYGTFGTWNRRDVFLTHVGTQDEVTISATPTDEANASLIASPGRPLRVIYTRVAPEPAFGGVARLFMRDEGDTLRRRSIRTR